MRYCLGLQTTNVGHVLGLDAKRPMVEGCLVIHIARNVCQRWQRDVPPCVEYVLRKW